MDSLHKRPVMWNFGGFSLVGKAVKHTVDMSVVIWNVMALIQYQYNMHYSLDSYNTPMPAESGKS